MTTYVSLLRGINVSGQKKVKMTDLKMLYESLGLQNVVTYIQSGNVIFKSDKEADILKVFLEQAIEQHYSFQVPVKVISEDEFLMIKTHIPFSNINVELDGAKVLITFLSASPKVELADKLMTYIQAPEKLIINDKIIFLHCPNGYGKTKLSNNFIENKLKVSATTRNLKTLIKLSALTLAQ